MVLHENTTGVYQEAIVKMELFSYKVARDYGFAPNPFGKYCTLATCKPGIRKHAVVGDWVIGTGTRKYKNENSLIYAMKVDEKISFNQYWHDQRFQYKKPIFNGSLKQAFGDNIYYFDKNAWHQSNSHHSNADGTTNFHNLNRDTQSDFVLISETFYYFGEFSIRIPNNWQNDICVKYQGYKKYIPKTISNNFIDWIISTFHIGIHAAPKLFTTFERYKGY